MPKDEMNEKEDDVRRNWGKHITIKVVCKLQIKTNSEIVG